MLQVAQLGQSRQLKKTDEALSKAVFEKWYGGELGMSLCFYISIKKRYLRIILFRFYSFQSLLGSY